MPHRSSHASGALTVLRRDVFRRPSTWNWSRLFAPADAASLAVFRMAFGALMVWEVWRYWKYGWIKRYFIDPTFFFRFSGFEWLPAPSPNTAYALWALMAVAALGMGLGCCYRISAAVMTLTFVYFFLLDASNYLNHFYLIGLLGGLMTVLPAQRIWSINAWRRGTTECTVPLWTIWLLRIQVGIPYFFGGIAKLERDWLLSIPMQQMLFPSLYLPIVGEYLLEWWVADIFAIGGLLFDLSIVPLLLWKRTRTFAFILSVLFHLTNKLLLNIGIFPWMMIAATTMFFEPDWPRRLPRVPAVPKDATPLEGPFQWTVARRLLVLALGLWLLVQFTVPLRHYFYPGNTSWTEVGHRFSWRMKLRSKEAVLTFYLLDPQSGDVTAFDPSPYVTERQFKEMAQHPDMVVQFARFLGERLDDAGFGDHHVRAEVWCSLNDRDPQLLINPEVDLSETERGVASADYILPLETPPGPRQQRALETVREMRAKAYSLPDSP